jgi:hypothetical protein
MQSCGMKELAMGIKIVGKSGQVSVGKAMAGMGFIMETLPGGDILLKHAIVVPVNERAEEWVRNNPAKETRLDELEAGIEDIS